MIRKLLALLTGLLVIPFAHANMLRPLESFGEIFFRIGSFVWITDRLSATKFAIFIILFALIYTVLAKGMRGGTPIFGRGGHKVSAVIAFSISAISVIFIPDRFVLQIGVMYSGILAALLIAFPVGLILFFGIWVTREDQGSFMGKSMNGDSLHWDNAKARYAIRALTGFLALFLLMSLSSEYSAVSLSLLPGGLLWRTS